MSITAKELAAKLGLSAAAVSMALNNKPGVSTATRKRIIAEALRLGYDFSNKRLLTPDDNRNICLVIYKKSGAVVDDTPFFSSLSEGVSLGCRKWQYDLTIRYIYEDDTLDDQLHRLRQNNFTGLILLATEMDEAALRPFSRMNLPLVVLDSYFDTMQYDCVLINNIQGAFLATNYLIINRKAQPGYLRSAYPIGNFVERADGFYKAIRASGMSTSKSVVHYLTPSQDGAHADMAALLQQGERPADCYFADNDHIAIGAIQALKEAGYRIPEDVAVVGFDDLPLCELMVPPLTTIHVPSHYIGEVAARRLLQIIEERDSLPVKIEIATTLKKRKSV